MTPPSLEIAVLAKAYAEGDVTPEAVLDAVYGRIAEIGERPVWITLVPREEAGRQLAAAQARAAAGEALPLFGIPSRSRTTSTSPGCRPPPAAPTSPSCRSAPPPWWSGWSRPARS